MSSPLANDSESIDINDALISEAARLENEYRNQEIIEDTPAIIDESAHGTSNLDSELSPPEIDDSNGEASYHLELSEAKSVVSSVTLTNDTNSPTKDVLKDCDSSVSVSKHVSFKKSSPEKDSLKKGIDTAKKRSPSSNLKRKSDDTGLNSIRPLPPDPKRLKSGFKIPKIKKNSSPAIARFSTSLTDEQKVFLEELEKEFFHRYSNLDVEYKKVVEADFPPPLVENFYNRPRRQFNRPEGSSHYDRNHDRNNRNSLNNSSRYNSPHQSKYNRDSNDRNRDHSNDRNRVYSNDRYNNHQRHRYQPY